MAIQVSRGKSSDASRQDTKTERTAPNKVAAKDAPPTELSRGGRFGNRTEPLPTRYGRNQYGGPSSLAPGEKIECAGARLATVDDPDLERVRIGAVGVGSEIRTLAAGDIPVHPAMRGAAPGPKVPNETHEETKPGPRRQPRAPR